MGVWMAGQSNVAPVIIKRKKVIAGGGHHGGAWKVAYADFVTAMMAFFLLMWLLNATTEKQRKGISDYFSPTIAVNRISGGGDGAFGGDSVFTEETLAQNGTGADSAKPTESNAARGAVGEDGGDAELSDMERKLVAKGGESNTMQQALRHVVTRVTDEGLVIEMFDIPGAPLFQGATADPSPVTIQIAALLAVVLALASNEVAVNGHVQSYPITLIENPAWGLSAARAQSMRGLMGAAGLGADRTQRISGYADRKPVTPDPHAMRNNRIEVILLRRNR